MNQSFAVSAAAARGEQERRGRNPEPIGKAKSREGIQRAMALVTNTNLFFGQRGLLGPRTALSGARRPFRCSAAGVHGFALSWHVYQTTHSAFWLGGWRRCPRCRRGRCRPSPAPPSTGILQALLLATQGALVLLAGLTAAFAMMSALDGAALLALSLGFGIRHGFRRARIPGVVDRGERRRGPRPCESPASHSPSTPPRSLRRSCSRARVRPGRLCMLLLNA